MLVSQTEFRRLFKEALETHKLGKLDDAWSKYQALLRITRNSPAVWNNLAAISLERGHLASAIVLHKKGHEIKADQDKHAVKPNLRGMLLDAGRAEDLYEMMALAPAQSDEEANAQLQILKATGRFQAALAVHSRINHDKSASDQFTLAQILLNLGKYSEGFKALEAREKTSLWATKRKFKNRWNHEDLEGKRIAIYGEMGLGDMIFSLRFMPTLRAMKPAHITAVASSPLAPLMKHSGLFDLTVVKKSFDEAGYDYVLYDTDLLHHFWGCAGIGSTPLASVNIPKERLENSNRHAAAVDKKDLRIGICWRTDSTSAMNVRKNILVDNFFPLFEVPQTTFFSLVKPVKKDKLLDLDLDGLVINAGRMEKDLLDTAATIHGMDLVITIDTAVAHIAASMGKPTWMLTPEPPYWYWNEAGETTSHYPTMRVVRQSQPGCWGDAIQRLVNDLERFISKKT